jgi:hypothetical protein
MGYFFMMNKLVIIRSIFLIFVNIILNDFYLLQLIIFIYFILFFIMVIKIIVLFNLLI